MTENASQRLSNSRRVWKALGWILSEEPKNQRFQGRRNGPIELSRQGGCTLDVLHGHCDRVLGVERQTPCEHLKQGDAKRVEVSSGACLLSGSLFRRKVVYRAQDRPSLCYGRAACSARNAEIGNLDLAILR